MTPFLIFITAQVVLSTIIFFTVFSKNSNSRLLLVIALGCALGLSSKIVIQLLPQSAQLSQGISSTVCFATFSFLYFRNTISQRRTSRWCLLLIASPFILSVLGFSLQLIFHRQIEANPGLFSFFSAFPMFLRRSVISFFLFAHLHLIWKHQQTIRQHIKSTDIQLSLGFTGHLVFLFFILFSQYLGLQDNRVLLYPGLSSSYIILTLIVYFKFIKNRDYQPELAKAEPTTPSTENQIERLTEAPEETTAEEKYKKNHSTSLDLELHTKEIKNLMASKQPFLDSNYSHTELAQDLKLSTHELSILLNRDMGTTFYQYINAHRIAHFIDNLDLVSQGECSILSLAYASGFHTKSTFNKYFKQETGLSPSEFIKRHELAGA